VLRQADHPSFLSDYESDKSSASTWMGSEKVRLNVPANHSGGGRSPLARRSGLLSGNSEGVIIRLDLQVLLGHPRQFYDGNEVIPLLKHVDRRKSAAACRAAGHPPTGDLCIKRALTVGHTQL
jgi:hypothetical protein